MKHPSRRCQLALLTLLLIGLALSAWIGATLLPDGFANPVQTTWQAPFIKAFTSTPSVTPGWWQQVATPTPKSTTPPIP